MQEKSVFDSNRILNISEAAASAEFKFQQEWNSIKPGTILRMSDKTPVKIISPGTWNTEAGPDFKNAKLKINNEIITGDVELHFRASDWERHGHSANSGYSNVILHVVAEIDVDSVKSTIPLLLMKTETINTNEYKVSRLAASGKCKALFANMTPEQINFFFTEAGIERFRTKAASAFKEMVEKGAETTCMKMLFDAAGYKNNRAEFAKLFERFQKYAQDTRETFPEAILWGESGFMPDPASGKCDEQMLNFTKNTWNDFWKIRRAPETQIKWHRNSTRPYNSPERRLAALIIILKKTSCHPLMFFSKKINHCKRPDDICNIILEQLTTNDKLWDNYINLKLKAKHPAALMGTSRAVETAANALLPALYAYFKINSDNASMDLIEKTWLKLPPEQNNKIIKTASEKWFNFSAKDKKSIFKSTASMQGIIHIYKEYCAKDSSDCKSCLIMNSENL